MDLQVLADEINTDPLGWGYNESGIRNPGPGPLTNREVADLLNDKTTGRTVNRTSMTGDEVFQATNPAEYVALETGSGNTPDVQNHWLAFCGRETIDPFATANVQFVTNVFGAGSVTLSNLNAARVRPASRAEELGLGTVGEGDVWDVRNG